MYRLSLQRDFEARHFLIGGDWGPENQEHAHPYRLEWRLEGERVDQHGYLVDLTQVEAHLEFVIERYRQQTLNEIPEFSGLNPSLENFARILGERLAPSLAGYGLKAHEVRLWESPTAWASYRMSL